MLTIGYGETGKHVVPGLRLTNEQEADARLRARLAKEFEPAVRRHVKVTLAQHQFDALVSLSFNIGAGAFHRSTLLRKLNAGDVAGAAEQFHVWKWAGVVSSNRLQINVIHGRKGGKGPDTAAIPQGQFLHFADLALLLGHGLGRYPE